jgi:hypothetical protein
MGRPRTSRVEALVSRLLAGVACDFKVPDDSAYNFVG